MDFFKKLWPTPFKVQQGNLISFLIQLLIFVIVCAVAGFVIGLLSGLPIVGFVFAFLGSLMELYGGIGAVLCILKFFGLIA